MAFESSSFLDESLLLDANEQGVTKEDSPFLMVKEYQIQYQKLEEELFSLKLKYKNLAKEYEMIKGLLVTAKSENERLLHELSLKSRDVDYEKLKQDNDSNHKTIDQLKELLGAVQNDRDRLQGQVNNLANELGYTKGILKEQQNLPEKLKNAEEENKKLKAENNQLLKDNAIVDDLHDKFRTANELVNTMQDQMKSQENKHKQNNKMLQDEIDNLRNKLDNAQVELFQAKNQIEKQNKSIDSLKDKSKKDEEELQRLKQDANNEKQKYTTFYAKYEVTRRQYKQVKITEKQTNDDFNEYKTKMEKLKVQQQNDISKLKDDNKQLKEELDKNKRDFNSTQNRLMLQIQQIENQREQEKATYIKEMEGNKVQYENEKQALLNQIKQLKIELGDFEKTKSNNTELEKQLEQEQDNNQELRNTNENLEEQLKALKKLLDEHVQQNQEKDNEIEKMKNELENLNNDMQDKNAKFDELQNNYNDEYVKMLQNETNLKEQYMKEMKNLEDMKNAEVEVYRRENSKMRHHIVNLKAKITACEKQIAELNDPHAHCILKSDFESMRKDIAIILKRNDQLVQIINETNSMIYANGVTIKKPAHYQTSPASQKEVHTEKSDLSPSIISRKDTRITRKQTNQDGFYRIVNQTIRGLTVKMTEEHNEIMRAIGEPCHEPVDISDIMPVRSILRK